MYNYFNSFINKDLSTDLKVQVQIIHSLLPQCTYILLPSFHLSKHPSLNHASFVLSKIITYYTDILCLIIMHVKRGGGNYFLSWATITISLFLSEVYSFFVFIFFNYQFENSPWEKYNMNSNFCLGGGGISFWLKFVHCLWRPVILQAPPIN